MSLDPKGGFLSSAWLNRPPPTQEELANVSLRKYLRWIIAWGGGGGGGGRKGDAWWRRFQQLLFALDAVAHKHGVSLANVAARWVLQQPAVGAVILGVRLGLRDHAADNARLFAFELDADDMAAIAEAQQQARHYSGGGDLMQLYGDCGGEYRARRRA